MSASSSKARHFSPLSEHSEANAQLDIALEQPLDKPLSVHESAATYAAQRSDPSTDQSHNQQASQANKLPINDLISEHVWRSSDLLKHRHTYLDTGFNRLNELLTGGGWPLGATTEIGLNEAGIGELRLVLPALAQAMNNPSGPLHCVWIAPPHEPFSPALVKHGIALERLTIVRARAIGDILWAAEQALLSQACAAVFTWAGQHSLSQRALRRLQLAAEKTGCWHVLFRHTEQLKQSSTSSLRLELSNDHYSRLQVQITKQTQGWGGQECTLSLPPHYERWQRLPAPLLPHSNSAPTPSTRHVRILAKAMHGTNTQTANVRTKVRNNVISLKQVS